MIKKLLEEREIFLLKQRLTTNNKLKDEEEIVIDN